MKPDFTFADLLTLNKFITPTIMTVVYWILMAIAIVSGLSILTQSVFLGILTVIFAPLYVRLVCEVLVLMFKIHGVLCEIRDQGKAS